MRPTASRHIVADQALSRAAGAPLVDGNAVRILRDGAANYPAWLDAVATASSFVHFDSYILHDDRTGNLFADALIERAKAGVRVRVVYDWAGAIRATPRAFWYRLEDAGVEVHAFNPPRAGRPLAWVSRDHRKMLAVDGRVAYVSGLCVGDDWVETPGRAAWRDTGIEIAGPAVADVHLAFAEIWEAAAGTPLPLDERPPRDALPRRGDVALRIIASTPAAASMLRLDALVAGLARERLWITDAYFVGLPGYVQAMTAAAGDGVDVRLLVPGASDLSIVRSLTRAGYRGLLSGGVRVFEWNGPMMHAKTAVADGLWARVGSTNLNLQSWMGNWELDVAIEDAAVAAEFERMFERDLANATEVVLGPRHHVRRTGGVGLPRRWAPRRPSGGPGRAAAGAMRLGHAMGAALATTRHVATAEAPTLAWGGVLLLALAAVAAWQPAWLAWPLAAGLGWLGLALVGAAWRARRGGDG